MNEVSRFPTVFNNPVTTNEDSDSDLDMTRLIDWLGDSDDESLIIRESAAPQIIKVSPKVLWDGTQMGSTGFIKGKRINQILKVLNSVKSEGVAFSPKPDRDHIMGGTCSAMSFSFLKNYLKGRKVDTGNPKHTLAKMEKLFKESSQRFRNTQFAFNLIARDKSVVCDDFKRAKMATLAAFHGLKITDASELIDFQEGRERSIAGLRDYLDKHEEGVFVIRALNVNQTNEKEEAYGHSVALIKEKGKQYLYNPNNGCCRLIKKEETESLYDELAASHRRFTTPEHRIYQIAETSFGNEI